MDHTLRVRLIPFIVSLALFMEALDMTILNTAIPMMAKSLHVAPINLKIALISYLLSLAIFIPISGWMADRFGARRIFIWALIIFTLSSFWCGWASHLGELVIARAVQGIGGALSIPVGRLIIVRLVERSKFMVTMNRVIMPALIGPALGPWIGGMIVAHFSWPWIFWVNVPVGIIAVLLAYFYLHELPRYPVGVLDIIGFLLFGCGLAGFTFGLSLLSEYNASFRLAGEILIVSILLLWIYYLRAKRQTQPLVNIHLFEFRTFRVAIIGNILSRLGFGGMPFLLPLFLQIPLGYSPQLAGFLVALTAVGAILTKTISQTIIERWGFRQVLLINTCLLSLGMMGYGLIAEHFSLHGLGIFTLFFGFISSLQYSTMNPLAYAEIVQTETSMVSSMMGTVQQLGSSFGVALTAIFLRWYALPYHHQLILPVFKHAFCSMAVLMLLALVVFKKLTKEDGKNLYSV